MVQQTPPDPIDDRDTPPPAPPPASQPQSGWVAPAARPEGARERPLGITILAVLAGIAGVLGLLGSLAIIGLGGIVSAGSPLGGLVVVIGILTLILAIAYLAFAYGAWTLKSWAWTLGLIAAGISIVLSLLGLVGGTGDVLGTLISLAIAGVIIYYLMTPDVKAAFGRA